MVATTSPRTQVEVLLVSPFEKDFEQLRSMLPEKQWHLSQCSGWKQARRFLRNVPVSVIICECSLDDGCWKDVLKELSSRRDAGAPLLVVASSLADDRLWSEVLNLGAHNVLAKPFDAKEVLWVLRDARESPALAVI